MITVEYLIFNDKKESLCSSVKSFEHFMQTDSDIVLNNGSITYENSFSVKYQLDFNKISNTEDACFHLIITTESIEDIEKLTKLLRAIRKRFSIITNSPQILFDGLSMYYASKAYPLIYEIENLMRKLLTKFMLINVGVNWYKTDVPDDVASSIKTKDNNLKKDFTYFHNTDFIQLKNFLFSEEYISNKNKLISTLKSLKTKNNLTIEDIESLDKLIPESNWSKHFSNSIDINEKELSNDWQKLYELRCDVAHNKTFTINDYIKLVDLINKIKPIIEQAIVSLSNLHIEENEKDNIEEQVIGSISSELGEFMISWNKLESNIRGWVDSKYTDNEIKKNTPFYILLKFLHNSEAIDSSLFYKLVSLKDSRNRIVHFTNDYSKKDIEEININLKNMLIQFNEFIKQ
ncbi:HEPN domain-containing protein [Psychrobacter okhotskensis]